LESQSGGRKLSVTLHSALDGVARVNCNGEFMEITYVKTQEGTFLRLPNGRDYCVSAPASKRARGSRDAHDGAPVILSPMPGKVLKIMVNKGDKVSKGQPVLVLEAMKMEHTLKAPIDGVINEINCSATSLVQAAQVLVTLHVPDSSSDKTKSKPKK
jgi:3-methylcrotonyl-CoA carboxylase alpha subunit